MRAGGVGDGAGDGAAYLPTPFATVDGHARGGGREPGPFLVERYPAPNRRRAGGYARRAPFPAQTR
jgi:hypothetical protein